jgi:hypothetical protein
MTALGGSRRAGFIFGRTVREQPIHNETTAMKNKVDAKARKPQVKIRDMKPKKDVKGGGFINLSDIKGESLDDKHKGT